MLVQLHLVDSQIPLVATYDTFNLAFTTMMLQNYFDTIAHYLEEAAWIDGASRAQSLMRIFLPLAAPAVTVTALFTFVNAWNEFRPRPDVAPLARELHAAAAGVCPGCRPVSGGMASRHGGVVPGDGSRGHRVRASAALSRDRQVAGAVK
ncbi:MAG: ABC transporter permease subunit [Acetobacteraceae bacterium]|nr:ABC transporter permease subunit [Acetobacteraceae bacterium]